VDLLDQLRQERDKAAACRKGVLGAQRRDAAAVLLAGLSASMSVLWRDSRSEWLFDVMEYVLGIVISGESMPTLTNSPTLFLGRQRPIEVPCQIPGEKKHTKILLTLIEFCFDHGMPMQYEILEPHRLT
jgi:hypothetical protein